MKIDYKQWLHVAGIDSNHPSVKRLMEDEAESFYSPYFYCGAVYFKDEGKIISSESLHESTTVEKQLRWPFKSYRMSGELLFDNVHDLYYHNQQEGSAATDLLVDWKQQTIRSANERESRVSEMIKEKQEINDTVGKLRELLEKYTSSPYDGNFAGAVYKYDNQVGIFLSSQIKVKLEKL